MALDVSGWRDGAATGRLGHGQVEHTHMPCEVPGGRAATAACLATGLRGERGVFGEGATARWVPDSERTEVANEELNPVRHVCLWRVRRDLR